MALSRPIDRSWLFAGLTLLLLVNALAPLVFQDIGQRGFAVSAANLFSVAIVFPIAAYSIWAIADQAADRPIGKLDWLVAGLALGAALLPLHLASKAALLPLSAYLLTTSERDDATYRIGFIGLALTGAFIWGAIILDAFAAPVLALDAALVRFATGAPVEGNILSIDPTQSGVGFDKIVIMRGCSSLRNVSQAVILWASMVQLFAVRITPAVIASCLLAILSMIVLNVVRIALIVTFPQHLAFIHHGLGSTMIGLAALVAAFAIIGWTIVRQPEHVEV